MKKVEETERGFQELRDGYHNQHVVGTFTRSLRALTDAGGALGHGADTNPTESTSGPVVQQAKGSGKK